MGNASEKRYKVMFLNDHMKIAATSLSPHECGRLFEMMRVYAMEEKDSDIKNESKIFRSIYKLMRDAQDDDRMKYEAMCKKNKGIAQTRAPRSVTKRNDSSRKSPVVANTIQSNSNQYNTNQDDGSAVTDDLSGQEIKGVPGVAWL